MRRRLRRPDMGDVVIYGGWIFGILMLIAVLTQAE